MSEAQRKSDNALPPGMILGPDGKPCKVCTAFRTWKVGSTSTIETDEKTRGKGRDKQSAAAITAAVAPQIPPANCPLDSEQLGRSTWAFLHTTAAYYPERPTPNQRANMLSLIRALPILYPCSHCADDFGEDLKVNPPDVSGRVGLSRWLCERHNQVNSKLGKESFDCAKTDERWKTGPEDGSCD
ncbi:ERV/ALR sulfhydryl oxidase domain-containing protein [Mycena floridula]|nr:ERV/ALR sulfhydryl oxidase domain-containing protein [Mycena floridula]